MPTRAGDGDLQIDEIDRKILEILASDARRPYADISDELAKGGVEMSPEAVRHRVRKLLDGMTSFFLPGPEQTDWKIVLVTARTADEPDAKQDVFEAVSDMNFWFVAEGLGSVDVYGIATAETVEDIDALLVEVRGLDGVTAVDYFIETDRTVNIKKYLLVS
jgi:DNA-binding Lrp family transcriptional regulator